MTGSGHPGDMDATHPAGTRAAPVRHSIRFGHLLIAYDERVLTPRPWTAEQSRWAADLLAQGPPGPVLELCAGAGHIGLLTVSSVPRDLVCVDLNPVACGYARSNADRAGLGDRVEVRHGDLAEAVRRDERFALVLADPPYLRPEEADAYPEDPRLAVEGGTDGLAVARQCLSVARAHLAPGGSALLQLRSTEQADRLRDELVATGGLDLTETRDHGRGVVALLRRA